MAALACMRLESEAPKLYTGGAVDDGMAPDIYTDIGQPNDTWKGYLDSGLNGFGSVAVSEGKPDVGNDFVKLYTGGAVDDGMAPDVYTGIGQPNDSEGKPDVGNDFDI